MILDTLITIFKADKKQLDAAVKEIDKGNAKLAEGFKAGELLGKKMSGAVAWAVKQLAGPLAALWAGDNILDGMQQQAAHMREITLLATKMRISAQDIGAMQRAFQHAGSSAASATALLEKLAESQRDLQLFGKSELLPLFQRMGVSAVDAAGKFRAPADMLHEIADVLRGLDPVKQQFLAQHLQIDQATLDVINKGGDALTRLIDKMKAAGPSAAQIEAGNQLSLSLSRLGVAVDQLQTHLLSGLVPSFQVLVEAMSSAFSGLSDLVQFMGINAPIVATLIGGVLVVAVGALTAALIGMAAAVLANPLTWLIAGIVAASVAIGLLIDDIVKFARGHASLIGDIVKAWPQTVAVIKAAVDRIVAVWQGLVSIGKEVFGLLGDIIGFLAADTTAMLQALGDKFPWLRDVAMAALGGIIDAVKVLWDTLKAALGWLFDAASTPHEIDVLGKVTTALQSARGGVQSARGAVESGARGSGGQSSAAPSGGLGSALRAAGGAAATIPHPLGFALQQAAAGSNVQVNIDATINTQATDPAGVRSAVVGGLAAEYRKAILQADSGVAY